MANYQSLKTTSPFPDDLLPSILQQVDLQHRLGVCALVSHSWRKATVAATTVIGFTWKKRAAWALLISWLTKHGSSVLAIGLESSVPVWSLETRSFNLPCQQLVQLRSLKLAGFHLTPCTADNSISGITHSSDNADNSTGTIPFAALRQLTSLELLHIGIDAGSAYNLTAMTQLQSPCLEQVDVYTLPAGDVRQENRTGAVFTEVLEATSQLSCLTVNGQGFAKALSMSLPGMTKLQELDVSDDGNMTREAFRGLAASLTVLKVSDLPNLQITSSRLPHLTSLTNLQHLKIWHVAGFGADVLASHAGRLTHLEVGRMYAFDTSVLNQLLCMLPEMQQLRHLALSGTEKYPHHEGINGDIPTIGITLQANKAHKFSLPPHLTTLALNYISIAEGAAGEVTDAITKLPRLQRLSIRYGARSHWAPPFSPVHVCNLLLSCPQLHHLDVLGAVHPYLVDRHTPNCFHILTPLTQLTSLCLGSNDVVTDFTAQNLLATLTALKSLEIADSLGLTAQGVLPIDMPEVANITGNLQILFSWMGRTTFPCYSFT